MHSNSLFDMDDKYDGSNPSPTTPVSSVMVAHDFILCILLGMHTATFSEEGQSWIWFDSRLTDFRDTDSKHI